MKQFTSKGQKKGLIGEDIAVVFLINNGFSIIERNYTQKIGEIDIVAEKENQLYFIEVKTRMGFAVGTDTRSGNGVNAFENITPEKIRKLRKTISYYLVDRSVSRETILNLSGLAVYLDWDESLIGIDFIRNLLGT